MKIRRLLLLTVVSALAFGPGGRAAEEREEHTELEERMEKIGGAFRALRRDVAKPELNEESLKRVATIREQMQAALKLEPAMTADKPAEEREKFLAAYRARMNDEIANLDKVEAALKAGNNEEAAKLVGALNDSQKDAHKNFKKKKAKKKKE